MNRFCEILRALVAMFFVFGLGPVSSQDENALDWASIAKIPSDELEAVAEKSRDAIFHVFMMRPGEKRYFQQYEGFFLSEDGFGLCPLFPLCAGFDLGFCAGTYPEKGGVELPSPMVKAVFPADDLALVKFDFQPRESLSISSEKHRLGEWVAVVSPPMEKDPLFGPILDVREMPSASLDWQKQMPEKMSERYSIATRDHFGGSRIFRTGTPVVNDKGKVVASFTGSNAFLGQNYRMAAPLFSIASKIEEAKKGDVEMSIPLAGDQNPYHPARLDSDFEVVGGHLMEMDFDKALEKVAALKERYPESQGVRLLETRCLDKKARSGRLTQAEVIKLGEQMANLLIDNPVAEDVPVFVRARYHLDLGLSYEVAQDFEKAIEQFELADELFPPTLACANLAYSYVQNGESEKAKPLWRRAAELEPERLEWIERVKAGALDEGNLEEALKWERRFNLIYGFYN